MKILFKNTDIPGEGTLILGVYESTTLSKTAKKVNAVTGGALTRILNAEGFTGKIGETCVVAGDKNTSVTRIVCVGLGKANETDALKTELIGAYAAKAALSGAQETVEMAADDLSAPMLAFGALQAAYRFDKYKTDDKKKPVLQTLCLLTQHAQDAQNEFDALESVAKGIYTARDVMNEPANVMTPARFAERAKELKKYGLEIEIYDKKHLNAKGFRMMLGVAQGAVNEPMLAVVRWKGLKEKETPVVLVGKGVCFDSGGISLKPANGMEDMKFDMAGAAISLGTMQALAMRKAKVNAAAIMPLVENMPSGTAQRPGDIVTSLSGQTVEVVNTDAEGRLILGDALWYAQERFSPAYMIDLATLTGACVVALGHEFAGLFSNDADFCAAVKKASAETGERVWELPLCDEFDEQITSDVADIANVGKVARSAGSSIGAAFLKRFVKPETKWAHLDIAGTAYTPKDLPLAKKGAVAFGVKLLNRLITDMFEK